MKPLQQILAEADQQKVAVGHFNISDLVALKAVYSALHRRSPNRCIDSQHSGRERLSHLP
jgi:fructose/tagatose bisphosphate aldolase